MLTRSLSICTYPNTDVLAAALCSLSRVLHKGLPELTLARCGKHKKKNISKSFFVLFSIHLTLIRCISQEVSSKMCVHVVLIFTPYVQSQFFTQISFKCSQYFVRSNSFILVDKKCYIKQNILTYFFLVTVLTVGYAKIFIVDKKNKKKLLYLRH